MNKPRKTMDGIAPSQYQCAVLIPYFAPFAVCPITSRAPRFADMKAIPVIQCEKFRFDKRKSEEVFILSLSQNPTPSTSAKYKMMIAKSKGPNFINMELLSVYAQSKGSLWARSIYCLRCMKPQALWSRRR